MIASPRVVLISGTDVVPEAVLVERLMRASILPPLERRHLMVQLRDHPIEARYKIELGRRLRAVTRELGASLVVNDRMDLARILDADGVHLGGRSVSVADARSFLGPDAWISVACHRVAEVAEAARAGAQAALLSPIFASPGKAAPLGLDALRQAKDAVENAIAVIALGGVDASSALSCRDAGADAIAVIRADLGSTLRALLAR